MDKNAKNPRQMAPVDLPGVKVEKYHTNPDDGTSGFNPQLSGHAKANVGHTSGFETESPDYTMPGYPAKKETAKPEDK